ncbi:MAG: CDP-alcohol phosphatidyltransferase family protein [Bacteroidia bacterium]
MTRHIPNLLTIANLFCGFFGIVAVFNGEMVLAGWMVIVAAIFDFLDGMAARMLKAHSDLGAGLDSLADMVSFGVLPGMIMMVLMMRSHTMPLNDFFAGPVPVVSLLAFLIPAFSAVRLAKFNIDTRQNVNFIGLPTPANALFFAALPLILRYDIVMIGMDTFYLSPLILNPWFLILTTLIFSYLLISPLTLFSLKMKHFGWKGNEVRYIFLIVSLALFIALLFTAIPIIIIFYIVLSMLMKKQIAHEV